MCKYIYIAFQFFRCTQLLAESVSLINSILNVAILPYGRKCPQERMGPVLHHDRYRTSQDTNLCAIHAKRVTIMPKDLLGVSLAVILNSAGLDFRSTLGKIHGVLKLSFHKEDYEFQDTKMFWIFRWWLCV